MHVEGDHAALLTRDGRVVPVDLWSVPDMARALLTFGREVEISGSSGRTAS